MGPVCGFVTAGGRAVYSQRALSVCVSLSTFFIYIVILILGGLGKLMLHL